MNHNNTTIIDDAYILGIDYGQDAVASDYRRYFESGIDLYLIDLEARIDEADEGSYRNGLIAKADCFGGQDEDDVFLTNASKTAELLTILTNHVNFADNFGAHIVGQQDRAARIKRQMDWYISQFNWALNELEDKTGKYATQQLLQVAVLASSIMLKLTKRSGWKAKFNQYTSQLDAYNAVVEAHKSVDALLKTIVINDKEGELRWLEEQPVNFANERCWLTEDEIITHLDATR